MVIAAYSLGVLEPDTLLQLGWTCLGTIWTFTSPTLHGSSVRCLRRTLIDFKNKSEHFQLELTLNSSLISCFIITHNQKHLKINHKKFFFLTYVFSIPKSNYLSVTCVTLTTGATKIFPLSPTSPKYIRHQNSQRWELTDFLLPTPCHF